MNELLLLFFYSPTFAFAFPSHDAKRRTPILSLSLPYYLSGLQLVLPSIHQPPPRPSSRSVHLSHVRNDQRTTSFPLPSHPSLERRPRQDQTRTTTRIPLDDVLLPRFIFSSCSIRRRRRWELCRDGTRVRWKEPLGSWRRKGRLDPRWWLLLDRRRSQSSLNSRASRQRRHSSSRSGRRSRRSSRRRRSRRSFRRGQGAGKDAQRRWRSRWRNLFRFGRYGTGRYPNSYFKTTLQPSSSHRVGLQRSQQRSFLPRSIFPHRQQREPTSFLPSTPPQPFPSSPKTLRRSHSVLLSQTTFLHRFPSPKLPPTTARIRRRSTSSRESVRDARSRPGGSYSSWRWESIGYGRGQLERSWRGREETSVWWKEEGRSRRRSELEHDELDGIPEGQSREDEVVPA